MSLPSYSPINRLVQRLAASLPVSLLLALLLPRPDRLAFRWSGGRFTLTSWLAGLPLVMLTTTGARSGQPRTVPLLSLQSASAPGAIAVVASNWGQPRYPAWYANLRANPCAHCQLNGQEGEYLAHEASGEEYDFWWSLAAQMYPGYPQYRRRAANRRIPIMVLEPVEEGAG